MRGFEILNLEIDSDVIERAGFILEKLGIPMNVAIEMYFRQIIFQRGIPFEVKLPADETLVYDNLTKEEYAALLELDPEGKVCVVLQNRLNPCVEKLKDMVESGMGKTMLEAGLPVDATNKIVNAMKISTNGTVINQRKELAKDSGYKKYFESDIKLETKEVNNSNRYATFGLKDTFTPTFVDAKTRAELAKNKSTMFIKS